MIPSLRSSSRLSNGSHLLSIAVALLPCIRLNPREGTYVRTRAIDRLIKSFLTSSPEKLKQIVSLGAGTDTRFFNLQVKSFVLTRLIFRGELGRHTLFDTMNSTFQRSQWPKPKSLQTRQIFMPSSTLKLLQSALVAYHSFNAHL